MACMISGDELVADSARFTAALRVPSAGLHLQIDGGIPKDEDLFVDDDHLLMMLNDG